ncbi:hypothetical protein [Tsukamurella tyrosinosolvens]|uniref:hypothetical protein n=1 Tax=Tsukamurella tyrosinosolvens TaxID=57704 RepID=UPI003461AD9D
MNAALIRTLPGDEEQLDLPVTPVEFLRWENVAGALMGVVAVTCAAFAVPYEMPVPADRIEVLS